MQLKTLIKKIPGTLPAAKAIVAFLDPPSNIQNLILHADRCVNSPLPRFFGALNRIKKESYSLPMKLQLLKALNLLVNKYEYLNGAIQKIGKPSGFMLDTVNACNLGCPTCQHTSNKKWAELNFNALPVGTLKPDVFDSFIRKVGLTSYAGHFYNNSEPFLNKRTPAYIKKANHYRVRTFVSSNMSIPKLDAEAIVDSGLDILMIAIDGATQEVYQRYRRGGSLELALQNVRNIVEAKKRLKRTTPSIRWQFLTFGHNVHQMDDAINLAKAIGCDSFNSATPYDVSADDPSISVANVAPKEVVFRQSKSGWPQSLEPIRDEIEHAFSEMITAPSQQHHDPVHGYCDWLHLGVIGDALGRVHPCCLPDYKNQGSFVFGNLGDWDIFNTTQYLRARNWMTTGKKSGSKCETCGARPLPQIGLGAIGVYMAQEGGLYSFPVRSALTGWSRHNSEISIPSRSASSWRRVFGSK